MPGYAWLRQALLKNRESFREQARVLGLLTIGGAVLTVTLTFLELLLTAAHGAAVVVALVGVLGLMAAVATLMTIWFSIQVLRDDLLHPMEGLVSAARSMSGGAAPGGMPQPQGAAEVRQLATTLGTLMSALATERSSRAADRRAGEAEATTLREVLRLTQDVGSFLEQGPIIDHLGDAARRIGGFGEVIIWRYDDLAGQLIPAFPAERLHSATPLRKLNVAESQVGRAATSGQTVRLRTEAGRGPGLAVPLAVGGVDLRVLGVLEMRDEGASEPMMSNPLDALEALASHAATALSAAQMHEQLEARSETDAMTKILNRRKLDADLKAEVSRSLRYGHPLTMIMVDVDHFKSFNDTFGHQTGDEVLKCVAATIARGRETDSAYRFGGEEFAVLLRETDAIAGRAVAERLRIKIKEAAEGLNLPRAVTASLGVSAVGPTVQTVDRLIESADQALYQAKETGRNKVVVNPEALPGPHSADATA